MMVIAEDIDLDVDKETDLLSVAQFYRNKRTIISENDGSHLPRNG